ncbi:MAG: hypothetical protein ACRDPT_10650 [Streptomycetales bacterium]
MFCYPRKGHVAIDPDSEIVTATTVTAGNTGDAAAAGALLAHDVDSGAQDAPDTSDADAGEPVDQADGEPVGAAERRRLAVYGDAAYGAGEFLAQLEAT